MRKIRYLLWTIGVITLVLIGTAYYLVESKLADEDLGHRGTLSILSDVKAALEIYRSTCSEYPPNLDALINRVDACPKYMSTDVKNLRLTDRWGNKLLYTNNGGSYKLISLGNSWLEATESTDPATVIQPK